MLKEIFSVYVRHIPSGRSQPDYRSGIIRCIQPLFRIEVIYNSAVILFLLLIRQFTASGKPHDHPVIVFRLEHRAYVRSSLFKNLIRIFDVLRQFFYIYRDGFIDCSRIFL